MCRPADGRRNHLDLLLTLSAAYGRTAAAWNAFLVDRRGLWARDEHVPIRLISPVWPCPLQLSARTNCGKNVSCFDLKGRWTRRRSRWINIQINFSKNFRKRSSASPICLLGWRRMPSSKTCRLRGVVNWQYRRRMTVSYSLFALRKDSGRPGLRHILSARNECIIKRERIKCG